MNFTNDSNDSCAYLHSPYLHVQFYVVTIFGSLVSIISIGLNGILLFMFLKKKFFRRSYFFYLSFLAGADILHSMGYILTFSTWIYFEFMKNYALMHIFYSYLLTVLSVADVVKMASVYILVAASIERYLQIKGHNRICNPTRRMIFLSGFLLFSVVIKGGAVFELMVIHRPNCTGLAQYMVAFSPIARNWWYQRVWAFWIRNILSVFLPFFLLIILNLPTVFTESHIRKVRRSITETWRRHSQALGIRARADSSVNVLTKGPIFVKTNRWVAKARSRVRKAATRSLIVIVAENVLSSGFGLVLTAWEHIDTVSLEKNPAFYTYSADIISLLSVLSCAIRLPSYWIIDVTFRKELKFLLCGRPKPPRLGLLSNPTSHPLILPRSLPNGTKRRMSKNAWRCYVKENNIEFTDPEIIKPVETPIEIHTVESTLGCSQRIGRFDNIKEANGFQDINLNNIKIRASNSEELFSNSDNLEEEHLLTTPPRSDPLTHRNLNQLRHNQEAEKLDQGTAVYFADIL